MRRLPPQTAAGAPPLRIALLNNMGEGALARTEGQWRARLSAFARPWRLELFRLETAPGPERSYRPFAELLEARVDALIVTGAEPRAERLEEDPLHAPLATLYRQARRRGTPSLWSCLAAHVAVHAECGLARAPAPRKISGVFPLSRRGGDPLLPTAVPALAPHSRLNGLEASALEGAGFRILTEADGAGVDAFALGSDDGHLFLQGHPEYGPETLLLEYRRDLARALAAPGAALPPPPVRYFAPDREAELADLAGSPRTAAVEAEARAALEALRSEPPPAEAWRTWGEALLAGWMARAAARSDLIPA